MNISELMKSSKEALANKWGLSIGTFLVFLLLSGGTQAIAEKYPFAFIISASISGPFAAGLSLFALKISRGEEARFEDSFAGFSNFLNSFLAYLLMTLLIIAGVILFIIPGIIIGIGLSMTFFIIAEDDQISAIDALKQSYKMMDGHKLKYFFLFLRYIGLALLCILTLGIGFLWLVPYMYVTNAKFYDDIKNDMTIDIIA